MKEIWLEVVDVLKTSQGVSVRFRGNEVEEKPVWWPVEAQDASELYKDLVKALDNKQHIHAQITSQKDKTTLKVTDYRIQYGKSAR